MFVGNWMLLGSSVDGVIRSSVSAQILLNANTSMSVY